jgi:hypothetical protein
MQMKFCIMCHYKRKQIFCMKQSSVNVVTVLLLEEEFCAKVNYHHNPFPPSCS